MILIALLHVSKIAPIHLVIVNVLQLFENNFCCLFIAIIFSYAWLVSCFVIPVWIHGLVPCKYCCLCW